MFETLVLSEATAARRRSVFQVIQSSDGKSALTGCTGTVRFGKNGVDTSASTNSIVEISSVNYPGRYYIEFTAAELNTAGSLMYRYKHANSLEVPGQCFIVTDDIYAAAPTVNDIADAFLKRDWTAVTGEASRSVLNALRLNRNRWRVAAGTLTVYKEDDTTSAWSGPLTGTPVVTELDPA